MFFLRIIFSVSFIALNDSYIVKSRVESILPTFRNWASHLSVYFVVCTATFTPTSVMIFKYTAALITSCHFMYLSLVTAGRPDIMYPFIFRWPCSSSQILANNQLDAVFHVFIYFVSLHVSSIKCSSSGDRIVLIHHLLAGIPSSHLHRLIISDDVLIQFDLLMMSTVMLEKCREMK
jgi:hypothetical protein